MQYCSCHCQLRIIVIVIPIQIKLFVDASAINITTITAHNEIRIHRIVFTFVILLFASCKLITSNFSERIFKSSVVDSATGSPSNSLTVVSSSFAKIISILESGTDKPFSHFDTVCLTTFSLIASSSFLFLSTIC